MYDVSTRIVEPCLYEGVKDALGGFGSFSRLSDVLLPLRSWVRALYRTSDRTWEEFANNLPNLVLCCCSLSRSLNLLYFLYIEAVIQ